MARARKPKPIPLAQVRPGDTFAIPLDNGRWGACRVVRKAGSASVAVVAVAWNGDAPPADLSDQLLQTPLILRHHSWTGEPYSHWVEGAVPEDFVALGNLPVTAGDDALNFGGGGWPGFRIQCLMQWRWDNERDAVLAEDEEKRQQAAAATQDARYAYQPATSLRELREKKPFQSWKGYVSAANIRVSRRILHDLIDELIALEDTGGDDARAFDAFRRAVERFNEADEESDDPFIMTIEREHICEELDHIADAAGLAGYDLEAWRDW